MIKSQRKLGHTHYLTRRIQPILGCVNDLRTQYLSECASGLLPRCYSLSYGAEWLREQAFTDRHQAYEGVEDKLKKSNFLFDSPVTKDWLFYLFIFFLSFRTIDGISNTVSSGGLSGNTAGIVSGLFDAVFGVFSAWLLIVPFYFVRKIFRKTRQ